MIFKKITGLFLAITLCMTSLTVSFAEEKTGYSNTKEAMEFLKTLEILPSYDDFSIDMSKEVNRADFVSIIAKLMNSNEFKANGIYYYDVTQTHWAYNEIGFLTEKGILSGNGNKLFYPDIPIRKVEAYKILLTAMGYRKYAEYKGGFPNGYIQTAMKINLSKGLSPSQNLTMEDMILLTYNALTTPLFEIDSISGDLIVYGASSENTLLSSYRNIYFGEGRVSSVEDFSLDGLSYGDNTAVIDGEKYIIDKNIIDYLGHKVEFYYHKNKNDRTLLSISKDDKFKEITVDNNAKFDAVSFTLTYYENDRNVPTDVKIGRGIKVLYNGQIVSKDIDKIFNISKYDLKLIKEDNEYTVAIVNSYKNLVVNSIDNFTFTVYDKIDNTHKLSLDGNDYDVLKILDTDGKKITFGDIKEGDVLSYFMSSDGRKLTVNVISEQITGAIEKMTKTDNGYMLSVNSVVYFMPEVVNVNRAMVGDNVVLSLDEKGEIAYCDVVTENSYFPAYLINGTTQGNAFSSDVKFRVFTKGGVKYFDGANKIKIDGRRYENNKCLDILSDDGVFNSQFAMVRTNKDGLINEIDTVKTNSEEGVNHLRVSIEYSDNLYYKQMGVLGHKGNLNDTTLIMSVPEKDIQTADDSEFVILERTKIIDAVALKGETYKTTDRIGYEQFVVLNYAGDTIGKSLPVLVDEIITTIDKNGEIIEAIEGYQGGTRVTVNAKEGFSFTGKGVEKGDIIRLFKDYYGNVTDITIEFDYSNPVMKMPTLYGWDDKGIGYVYDVINNVVKIGASKPVKCEWSIPTSNTPVLICETKDGKIAINMGNINDAESWYNVGENCSVIFSWQEHCTPKMFVIYR